MCIRDREAALFSLIKSKLQEDGVWKDTRFRDWLWLAAASAGLSEEEASVRYCDLLEQEVPQHHHRFCKQERQQYGVASAAAAIGDVYKRQALLTRAPVAIKPSKAGSMLPLDLHVLSL